MTPDELEHHIARLIAVVFGNGKLGMDEQLRNVEREMFIMKKTVDDTNIIMHTLKLEWASMRWRLGIIVLLSAFIGTNIQDWLSALKGLL